MKIPKSQFKTDERCNRACNISLSIALSTNGPVVSAGQKMHLDMKMCIRDSFKGLIHLLPRTIRQVLYFSGLLRASGMMEMTDLALTDLPVYNAVLAEIRITSAFAALSVW